MAAGSVSGERRTVAGMSIPAFLSIVTLGVADLPRAVAFYEALGWTRAESSMDEIVWFGLSGGAVWLGLFPHGDLAEDATLPRAGAGDGLPAYRGMTLAMNLASDQAVLEAFDAALAAGATAVKVPAPAVYDGLSGYFADPDGHLWEVAHNAGFPLHEDGRITIP
jgi:catechol 2,3-dioxygenase-like lactoylglutathione lyase family enzyme